jgi:hypothetical protein
MTKSDILSECARRIGDTNSSFITSTLSPAFDFVLIELAAEECVGLLRKLSTFALNVPGVNTSDGLTSITLAHSSVLNLAAGRLPQRIKRVTVPSWGWPYGRLRKADDEEFERYWLAHGASYSGQPRLWRQYPTPATLQLWPAVSSDWNTATLFLEWIAAPTTLTDNQDITELMWSDLPTILAGLYRVGVKFQDETIADSGAAEALWLAGVAKMRARHNTLDTNDRDVRIKYRE